MNTLLIIFSIVLRFLLFFTLVRNIARNKAYGWDIKDYSGMAIVGLVLIWGWFSSPPALGGAGWFSSLGVLRLGTAVFLLGTIMAAIFEGLDNRRAALISGMAAAALLIALFLA